MSNTQEPGPVTKAVLTVLGTLVAIFIALGIVKGIVWLWYL